MKPSKRQLQNLNTIEKTVETKIKRKAETVQKSPAAKQAKIKPAKKSGKPKDKKITKSDKLNKSESKDKKPSKSLTHEKIPLLETIPDIPISPITEDPFGLHHGILHNVDEDSAIETCSFSEMIDEEIKGDVEGNEESFEIADEISTQELVAPKNSQSDDYSDANDEKNQVSVNKVVSIWNVRY